MNLNDIARQYGCSVFSPGMNPAIPAKDISPLSQRQKSQVKIASSLRGAIQRSGLRDGMTISFHHHFRNGDFVINMVLDELQRMGFKDLYLAASSLNEIHEPIIGYIQSGLIRQIDTWVQRQAC